MAERTETVRSEPLQELRTQIGEPLSRWVQNVRWVETFYKEFYKPGGPFDSQVSKVVLVGLEAVRNETGRDLDPEKISLLRSRIKQELALLLRTGKPSGHASNAMRDHGVRAQRAAGPEISVVKDQIDEQIQDTLNSLRPHQTIIDETSPKLEEALSETFENHPEAVLGLPSALTTDNDFARDLATFLANTRKKDILPSAIWQFTLMEKNQPSTGMLNRFLGEMARKHYEERPNGFWEMLELALDQDPSTVREAFAGLDTENPTKNAILASLVSKLVRRGSLPQPLGEKFSAFIDHQAEDLLVRLNQIITPFKFLSHNPKFEDGRAHRGIGYRKKAPQTPPAQKKVPEQTPTAEGKPVESAQTRDLVTESETDATPKYVVIGQETYASESDIRKALEEYFDHNGKVNRWTPADLVQYARYLATEANLPTSAVPTQFLRETMQGVPRVKFPDGKTAPLLILKRPSKNSPRLAIAERGEYIVVLDAWDRNGKSYSNATITTGFTYETIQLPH